jgi:O-antigen ligase
MATQPERPEESTLDTTLGWLAVVLAVSLPLYRPWVTLATTTILILWLFGSGLSLRARRLRGHRLTIAVLLFIALNISSLLWTSDLDLGLRYLTKYRYFLLIPMVASSVRQIYRRYAVTAFELSAGVAVVLSVGVLTGVFRLRDAHPGNPSPTMAHLDFGILLALAALFILARVLYTDMNTAHQILWTCLAVLTIFGLMINVGLAGHLAFAAGLIVLLVHWAWGAKVRLVATVTAGLVLILLLVWFSLPQFRARVDETRAEVSAAVVDQRYDSNLGGRVAALKVAREIFRDHPMLGTGVGGNIPAFQRVLDTRFEKLKPSIYWYRHYHNQYAQVATELGTVGLLALAWIFWELIRVPHRRRETDAAALILATVYLIGFLGEPFFHKQVTLVMFAFFAGLISAEDLEVNSPDGEGRAVSR